MEKRLTHILTIPAQQIELIDNTCHHHRVAQILTDLNSVDENHPDDQLSQEIVAQELIARLEEDENLRWRSCPLCQIMEAEDYGLDDLEFE